VHKVERLKTSFTLGDWNFICDKCGMKRKASTGKTQWDGLFVCPQCYDTRHPQDLIEGIPDDQSVPIARPDVTASSGETTVKTTASRNAVTIDLNSTSGISDGDSIGIVMDNGAAHWTYSDGDPSGDTVTLGSYLPDQATAGNAVYLPNINNESYTSGISATEL
jgi:hypothetical protein